MVSLEGILSQIKTLTTSKLKINVIISDFGFNLFNFVMDSL